MEPLSVSTTIDRPREEVFAYLEDIANHPEFSDHYLVDWRLTRVDTIGRGAGARFRYTAPLQRFDWADVTLIEVEAPRRIVQAGRAGKANRTRMRSVWDLEPASGNATRVTLTVETRPVLPSDRFMESLGARGWFRRKGRKALRRLRSILEEGKGRGPRATIAGLDEVDSGA
jgi:uncharacterized protein YndB with AHSA1/START domain